MEFFLFPGTAGDPGNTTEPCSQLTERQGQMCMNTSDIFLYSSLRGVWMDDG